MSRLFKNRLPSVVFTIVALILWVTYFTGRFSGISDTITSWGSLMWAFALILSAYSFLVRSIKEVSEKTEYWQMKLWGLVLMLIFFFVAMFRGLGSDTYGWLTSSIYMPLTSASWIMSFLLFLPNIPRMLKLKDYSSLLILGGVSILTLRTLPAAMSIPAVSKFVDWCFNTIVNPTYRAWVIGAGIGIVTVIVKSILGLQKVFGSEGGADT